MVNTALPRNRAERNPAMGVTVTEFLWVCNPREKLFWFPFFGPSLKLYLFNRKRFVNLNTLFYKNALQEVWRTKGDNNFLSSIVCPWFMPPCCPDHNIGRNEQNCRLCNASNQSVYNARECFWWDLCLHVKPLEEFAIDAVLGWPQNFPAWLFRGYL